jgi:hypothetical protein
MAIVEQIVGAALMIVSLRVHSPAIAADCCHFAGR